MTRAPQLADLPAPARVDDGDCSEGCYSGKQIDWIIDQLLGVALVCYRSLSELSGLSSGAATKEP